MSLYDWLFTEKADVSDKPDYPLAHSILEWASQPYTERFMRWLEEEALRPSAPDADKLAEAYRADAFKEVRAKIRRTIAAAENAVAHEREA